MLRFVSSEKEETLFQFPKSFPLSFHIISSHVRTCVANSLKMSIGYNYFQAGCSYNFSKDNLIVPIHPFVSLR